MERDEVWITAQQSVIGSCLIDQRAVGSIVFNLCEDDFQDVNRTLYRIIRERYTTGKAVDPVAVLGDLAGSGDGKAYKDYIMQLVEVTPSAANIKTYADICYERSRLNRYKQMAEKVLSATNADDADKIVRNAATISVRMGMSCWTFGEGIRHYFDNYGKPKHFIPWFIPQLDFILDYEFGDLVFVAGRPSAGKSCFALESTAFWGIIKGYRTGYYSLETSKKKLTARMLSSVSSLPLNRIKHETLNDKEINNLCDISARVAEAPIDLLDAAGKTVADIMREAISRRHQIVVIDYIQILDSPGKSEYEQVNSIVKELKKMCRQLNVLCIAISSLTRTRGERPTMEDLRGSGNLEYAADGIFLFYKDNSKPDKRELIITKNKENECGTTLLHFDGERQHFSYIGRGDAPLKGVDYYKARYNSAAQELEQLGMDTAVPFEEDGNATG